MENLIFELGLGVYEKLVLSLVIVVFGAIAKALADLAESNKENAKTKWLSEMLYNASEMVKKAVILTNKKFVDELKERGSFTQEDMRSAFERSIVTTKQQMTPEVVGAIKEVYRDVDQYIDLEIEKQVEELKANKKKILEVVEESRP